MKTHGRAAGRIASITLALCAGLQLAHAQTPTARLDTGVVSGATSGAVTAFKGIPYAAPPVGPLRWRAPQPARHWDDVRAATQYAADCMQMPFPGDAAPLGTPPAEDCLYVNVWRPSNAAPGAKLPVMVWIYGGGFVNGGSSPAVYDGSRFAEQGMVFVSFNYRLGRFGFFGFPALTAENADGMLGNYAFMDQIAALQWVKRNIGGFGGDPSQVTVFGESAGGFSVDMLLTSPLAEGLFQRAIIESGGGRSNLGGQRYLSTAVPNGPESAEAVGVKFAHSVGVDGTGAAALARLRALPAETIRADLNMATSRNAFYAGPMVDGRVVMADPQSILLAGDGARVPVMIGANSADIGSVPGNTKQALFAPFGVLEAAAVSAYDPQGTASIAAIRAEMGMDRTMEEPARFLASVFASRGLPSYEYRFSYVADSMRKEWPGAPHATEIPFVFDTVAARYGDKLTPADETISRQMLHYWASFVKTGDPSSGNTPAWPRYSPATDTLMDFTLQGPVAEADPWKARFDVTAAYVSSSAPPAPPAGKP